MAKQEHGIDTQAIHAGTILPRIFGAVSPPIFQSSTFESTGREDYKDIRYMRLNNTPNHLALNAKIAALEGGEAAMVMGSGMAAIATTLVSVLKSGDHLLAQNCLYGGTYSFLHDDAKDLGWEYSFFDAHAPNSWSALLQKNTKAIYVESLTNPLLQVGDLEAVVAFAKAHKLISIIDSTFSSAVNFRPLELGFDLVVHSCTKYMNGHSDLIAGCAVGSAEWIDRINYKLIHFGGSLDTHACFLLERGLKTLPLRMRRHNENTLALARYLQNHPKVAKVNYPGLETHPDHQRARKLMTGFGGVLSFELRASLEETEAMLRRLEFPAFAPSLGGVETLVTIPALSSHRSVPVAERRAMGVSDQLVRVAVGIENVEDLINDFDQAFAAVKTS